MVPSILPNPLLSLGDRRGVWESAVESLTQRDGETWGHSGELPVAFGSFRTELGSSVRRHQVWVRLGATRRGGYCESDQARNPQRRPGSEATIPPN